MQWFSKEIYDAFAQGCDFPEYGGSTKNLKVRQGQHRRKHPDWFGRGVLKAIRKVEGWFETEDSFNAYVAVVEQKHIVDRGYDIGLGENQVLPVEQYLDGFCPVFEMTSKGGRIGGHKNVESGHIQALGKHYGLIQGLKNAESGRLARFAAKGGRIGGRKNVESGHLARIAAEFSAKGICSRWNIRRGKPCACGQHNGIDFAR